MARETHRRYPRVPAPQAGWRSCALQGSRGTGAGACEALLEVPDQIVDVLDADRESDRPWTDARRLEFLVVELAVRRARRMNDEALGITDIREVRPERYTANELLARLAAAANVEREHSARAARQVFVGERAIPARAQARVPHIRGELVGL